MKTKRETIIFYLPLSMDSLTRDVSPVSGFPSTFNNNSLQLNGAQNGSQKTDGIYWDKKKMYINPSQIRTTEQKNIKDTLTKGGYSIQYWGENLTSLEVSGTTGSSGIEGINVLYSIYRHEQLHFPKILEERDRRLAQEAIDQSINSAQQTSDVDNTLEGIGLGLTFADAILTGGAISSTINGLSSAVGVFSDLVQNGGSDYTPALAPSIPTLAAFATNIQMYHDGVFYRGYFTSFGFNESGESPGLFDYNFSFKVTRKYGERNNFMPWHRNPLDANGKTEKSQGPIVSKGTYPGVNRLSFPLEPTEGEEAWQQNDYDNFYRDENSGTFVGTREQKSRFLDPESAVVNKSISRRKLITG
jgi:hypothetical protein